MEGSKQTTSGDEEKLQEKKVKQIYTGNPFFLLILQGDGSLAKLGGEIDV